VHTDEIDKAMNIGMAGDASEEVAASESPADLVKACGKHPL
jgi:hypothetical protein